MEKPVYITKKEVARLLNVSESTVYRWNKTRYILSSFQYKKVSDFEWTKFGLNLIMYFRVINLSIT